MLKSFQSKVTSKQSLTKCHGLKKQPIFNKNDDLYLLAYHLTLQILNHQHFLFLLSPCLPHSTPKLNYAFEFGFWRLWMYTREPLKLWKTLCDSFMVMQGRQGQKWEVFAAMCFHPRVSELSVRKALCHDESAHPGAVSEEDETCVSALALLTISLELPTLTLRGVPVQWAWPFSKTCFQEHRIEWSSVASFKTDRSSMHHFAAAPGCLESLLLQNGKKLVIISAMAGCNVSHVPSLSSAPPAGSSWAPILSSLSPFDHRTE